MADTLMPRPDHDAALTVLRAQAHQLRTEALALGVSTKDEAEFATAYLGEIARIKRDAEARRVALVKPHNEHVAAINGFVRAALVPVLEADTYLRKIVLHWQREEQRKAEEERERRRQEAEAVERQAREEADRRWKEALALRQAAERAAREEDAQATAKAKEQARLAQVALDEAAARENAAARQTALAAQGKSETTVRAGGMGTATVRRRWTYRLQDLSQVPVRYLALDEGMVRRAIGAGERDIPGLDIFQEDELAVGR